MPSVDWDHFEWDGEDRKNGNVQHLRDHGIEPEEAEEGKTMKKKAGKPSKAEQEKLELEYHRMNPEDFDHLMKNAKHHTPAAIRLPAHLIETLKLMAELEGEPQYQTLVRRWIEERLQQEAKLALKLSQMPLAEVVAVLERQISGKLPTRA